MLDQAQRIIHGDALEVIPSLGQFDYVLTDPPYPTGGESSIRAGESVKSCREMIDGMAQSFLAAALRAVKKADKFSIWLFCDWRQVSFMSSILRGMGPDKQSCIVWDKISGSLSPRYHPSHEMILWASNSAAPKAFLGRDLVQMARVRKSQKTHPFAKPPELVKELCHAFPPGRVLDPFCGSGGLLVGAQALGWETVGIDIDKDACERARDMLVNLGI